MKLLEEIDEIMNEIYQHIKPENNTEEISKTTPVIRRMPFKGSSCLIKIKMRKKIQGL